MRQEFCHVVMRFSRIGSFRASAFSPARPKLGGKPPRQLGAPLFCLAVEENCGKGCGSCARP